MIITIAVLSGLVVYLGIINYIERREAKKREADLLNRLMAQDLAEYTMATERLEESQGKKKPLMPEVEAESDTFPVT